MSQDVQVTRRTLLSTLHDLQLGGQAGTDHREVSIIGMNDLSGSRPLFMHILDESRPSNHRDMILGWVTLVLEQDRTHDLLVDHHRKYSPLSV